MTAIRFHIPYIIPLYYYTEINNISVLYRALAVVAVALSHHTTILQDVQEEKLILLMKLAQAMKLRLIEVVDQEDYILQPQEVYHLSDKTLLPYYV
jgi:hypothetical protein